MLDTKVPRPPGDTGNALTWPFPVRYHIVKGAVPARVMGERPDPTLLQPFIDGARALEADGVHAITTSCGFLAAFQRELAAAVSIPVLASSLLQVPLAARVIGPGQRVGIITERSKLTEEHFLGVGWSSKEIPVVIGTLPDDAVWTRTYIGDLDVVDTDVLERELVDAVLAMRRDHPEVGAIVLEATNFVAYGQAMRRAARIPIFDVYTLCLWAHLAIAGTAFPRPQAGPASW